MSDDVRGIRSAYAGTSSTNATDYQIKQSLREVFTNFLAFVKTCESAEETTGATYVSALPAVMQTDGQDNGLQMAEIPKCPHYRIQQGICALVIDPVPGDIGIFSALKADSTTVSQGVTEPQRPGSLREFSQSNAVMVGTVHTKAPENWITLRQDKTREGYAPEGIKDRTDKDLVIQVGQNVTITVGQHEQITISGNFTGTVQGNASLNVSGTVDLTAGGAVSIKAPSVTIDAPTITATGNMTVQGTLTAANGTMHAGGGTFSMQGSISATGDVQGGGISLTGHTHTEQGDGAETSGPH